jgi:hypothetical protein
MTYIRHSTLGLPTSPNPSPHRSQLDLGSAPLLWPSSSSRRPSAGLLLYISALPLQCSADLLHGAKDGRWKTSIFFYRPMVHDSSRVAGRNNSYSTCRGSSSVSRSTGARALLLHCLCPASRPPGRRRIPPGHGEAPVLQGPHRPQLRGHLASCTGLLV